MRERGEEGSVPGVVISGAVSAEKPDSQMAALSVREVQGSGRGPAAPTDEHYFKVDSLEILAQDECVNLASGRGGAERKSGQSGKRA